MLFVSIGLFAYSYPPTLHDLLVQYCAQEMNVHVATVKDVYEGYIRLVADDYILMKENESLTVISLQGIVEVYTLEDR